MLIIAFLSTVLFNPHNIPVRRTVLSPFDRWGHKLRGIKYFPKTLWSVEQLSHSEPMPVWALPRSLVWPPVVSETQSKTQWYTWDTFCIPNSYEARSWFFTANPMLVVRTFISGEIHLFRSEMGWFFTTGFYFHHHYFNSDPYHFALAHKIGCKLLPIPATSPQSRMWWAGQSWTGSQDSSSENMSFNHIISYGYHDPETFTGWELSLGSNMSVGVDSLLGP